MGEKEIEKIPLSSSDQYDRLANDYKVRGCTVKDLLGVQLEELKEVYRFTGDKLTEPDNIGELFYFDHNSTLLRILPKTSYLKLLTSRNRNLINLAEQKKFQGVVVGIAGLSVGSNICSTLVMQGGPLKLLVADPDVLSTSNLNRVPYNLFDVGDKKIDALKKKLLAVNPYCEFKSYNDGLTANNIGSFVGDSDIIFDEIDNLALKIHIRDLAKEERKPVIMITDNGDNIMIDIERYDSEKDLPLFHGLLSDSDVEFIKSKKGSLTPQDRVAMSLKIVGPDNAVPRMQESLLEVGKTLNTWPQLGTASNIAGAVGSYIVRKISNGDHIINGRLHISIDEIVLPDYNSKREITNRRQMTIEFLKKITDIK